MIEEKAIDLGRMIGQTEEYKALKRAHEQANDQRQLQEQMNQLGSLAQEIDRLVAQGQEPPKDKVEQYNSLLSVIQADSVYQAVVAAQANFDKLMTRVNEQIMEGIKKGAASPIITLS